MTKEQDKKKLDMNQNNAHNEPDDVVFDDVDEENFTLGKLKKLRETLKKCEEERKAYLEGWQRTKADFINARKRDQESAQIHGEHIKEDIILSILPVLDSFDRAFEHTSSEKAEGDWKEGVRQIKNQLSNIMKDLGITPIDPLGLTFNPEIHDSIEVKDVEKTEDEGRIITVLEKGYSMNGKVIRHAKVVVGKHGK